MAVEYRIPNLREKLEHDLHAVGITQRELAARMSVDDTPLTEQALSNWKRTGLVPRRRWSRLKEILGADALVVRSVAEAKIDDTPAILPRQPYSAKRDYFEEPYTRNRDDQEVKLTVPTAMEQSFVMALPEQLRANVDAGALIGGSAIEFDYLSPKLALEFKRIPPRVMLGAMDLDRSYRSVVHLALAMKAEPGRTGVLVLFLADKDGHRPAGGDGMLEYFARKLIKEAAELGVKVMADPTPEQVARLVIEIEHAGNSSWRW